MTSTGSGALPEKAPLMQDMSVFFTGTFSWPKSAEAKREKMRLKPESLGLLLDGVDLRGAQMRAWYER